VNNQFRIKVCAYSRLCELRDGHKTAKVSRLTLTSHFGYNSRYDSDEKACLLRIQIWEFHPVQ
jgi:hypothetical protein